MAPQSAGILLFRRTAGVVQFLLAHPGGPFWSKKDEGSWSIPKGLYQEHETAIDATRRELQEEIGLTITGDLVELGKFKQPSGKMISAWAAESDFDVAELRRNSFSLGAPPTVGGTRLVLDHGGGGKNHERTASHLDETGHRARPRRFPGGEDVLVADKASRFAYLSGDLRGSVSRPLRRGRDERRRRRAGRRPEGV